jgi:trimeric autotransporter adhesin
MTYIDPAYPLASHPDQVFRDGALLQQVSGTPGPGQFAVNYSTDTLTIGDNPAGHALRASDLQQAFIIAGQVTMRGFGVERYATSMPQLGAICEGGDTGSSTFENLVVDDNAFIGINLSQSGNWVDHVTADRNGMSGIEIGTGGPVITNETVQYSELDANNTHHFNAAPSSGGIKVGTVNGLLVKGNHVQNNHHESGIWTDQNTTNFTIVDNLVTADGTRGINSDAGILNELSAHGIVAGNTIAGFQEGITMMDTGDVQIINNTVYDNTTWDIGLTQDDRYKPGLSYEPAAIQPSTSNPWMVQNITVENNVFADSTGGMFQFYALDRLTNRPASSMNLVIQGNLFTHKDNSAEPTRVGWGGADNTTDTNYQTPSDFAAGVGKSWANAQTPTVTTITAMTPYITSQSGVAVPLAANVASAVGQPTGTAQLGAF